jgi:hypothetical protein
MALSISSDIICNFGFLFLIFLFGTISSVVFTMISHRSLKALSICGIVVGGGIIWHCALSFCELFLFYQTCNLTLVKKYLKAAIDESLILAIVSRNYSTKPSYIFQLKRELKVWKYIFNLFHFEVLIQNRNPKFRSLSLFVLTFHEYKARFVFGFRLDYKLSLFILFFVCVELFCVLCMCYNQYKLNNSSDPR